MARARTQSPLAPLAVFVAVAAVFAGLWFYAEFHERDELRQETARATEQVAIRLESYLAVRLGMLRTIRDEWVRDHISSRETFVEHADIVHEYFPGIIAINWIDAAGTIRWVVPEEPNLAAKDRDLTVHPVAGGVLEAARTSGELMVTPPIELYQGGRGFAAYLPVRRDGAIQGYVNAAFRIEPLIEDSLRRGVREEYYFTVHDGGLTLYAFTADGYEDGRPFRSTGSFSVGNRTWRVALEPNADKILTEESGADDAIAIAGALLAIGLALLTWRLQRSRAELRESRESYRRLVEDTPALICRFRADTTLTFVNQAYADYFGRTPEQLEGTRFLELVPEDARDAVLQKLAALSPEAPSNVYDHEVIAPDGERRWQQWRDRALFDEHGELYEYQSVGVDVTENRRVEQTLRESEERFRTIFDSVNEAIFIFDERGKLLDANRRASEMFGYPREELLQLNPERLAAPVPQPDDPWYQKIEQPGTGSRLFQWEARHRSGRAWAAEVTLRRTSIGGRDRVLAAIRDVTQRRKLEEQLRQAQKMEAVGTLAGGIAHDFNNILTAVLGHAELARMQRPAEAGVTKALDGIFQACEQASGLTRSLLTFSRSTPVQKSRVDFGLLVSDTVRMLGPMLPDAIEVECRTPVAGDAIWVEADRTQLQQVLMNLAVNSRDAMPGGGKIRISLEREPGQDGDAGRAVLTVSDTGAGMPEEVRRRVVEPFFTTKARERGTGLGMAVVHAIVINHSGTMDIESRVGRGTRVSVRLPCCGAPSGETLSHPELERGRGRGERILVVEDNEQVLELISGVMRSRGYDVVEARDGAEAVEAYRKEPEALRLLILDVDLPKLSGTACLELIRKSGGEAPAILISGNPEFDQREGHRVGNGDDVAFLAKPFAISRLADLVGKLLGRDAGLTTPGQPRRPRSGAGARGAS